MPAVFFALFYDKLTGGIISFCRIFQIRRYRMKKRDKVSRAVGHGGSMDQRLYD